MNIKKEIEKKKKIKETAGVICEGIKPLIDALGADRNTREEKRIYEYFRSIHSDKRVKDVLIVNDIMGSKVLVQFQDKDNNFETKKYSYEKLMEDINAKENANISLYGRILDRYSEFMSHMYVMVLCLKDTDVDEALKFKRVMAEFHEHYRELQTLKAKRDSYYIVDVKELERLDQIIKGLAQEVGIELPNDESLTEASIRKLLDKDTLNSKEGEFIMSAFEFLREKSKENDSLKKYSRFSKLSKDEKVKVSYYELLFTKLTDYQFSLCKESVTGEMMNKLFVESSQKKKRKENMLMDKVLNDESLEDEEYIDLAFMDMEYDKMDVHTLLSKYTTEDIEKRMDVYMKLIKKDPKRRELYGRKVDILGEWARLIDYVSGRDYYLSVNLSSNLSHFISNLSCIHLQDIEKYTIAYKSNEVYEEGKEEFDYQYVLMLKKMIEVIDSDFIEDSEDISMIRRLAEKCLADIKKDNCLLKISKTLGKVDDSFPKSIYDYKSVVEAYYNSFSDDAAPNYFSWCNRDLREIVDLQVAEFEKGLSDKMISMIKDDKLVLPKKYIKQ